MKTDNTVGSIEGHRKKNIAFGGADMVNIIFLCLSLLGAILSFGPNILDAGLAGVASIDFVSAMDVIVFGIMMAILVALCAFWIIAINGKKESVRTIRAWSWSVVGVVLAAYVVLVCSIWADSWLTGYRAWIEASADGLRIACYIGWLCMVCSGGWVARVIYERCREPKNPASGSGK